MNSLLVDWQRLINDEHRLWSGVDDRNPRLIFLKDVTLRKTTRRIGHNAAFDLRDIKHGWIADALTAWLHEAPRGIGELPYVVAAWTLASEVLAARGTPTKQLGRADMDAVVKAIRQRWTFEKTQGRKINALSKILHFIRDSPGEANSWREVPSTFAISPTLHRPVGLSQGASSSEDAYRFVPQPIVDWVMDHLHLLVRKTRYLTTEARAMLFVHERCGRRTGETTALLDDCISYDSQGQPYLEWMRGKPPWGKGERLPIHQETHDVIRQWQDIKKDNGIASKWLFPSQNFAAADRHYNPEYLGARLRELLTAIATHAPYLHEVEGADGNFIHFDLQSIDPYSFRHAFAQRYADATDENGRSSTPPDVLQSYMGHKNYNTTMAYYQVTLKRRKQALLSIAPRRLNLHGAAVEVSRERDGFGKVAVTLGHCTEPQNVAANGHGCALEHSCESCPFFLVDPLERDGIVAKRHQIKVNIERAKIINSPQHILDHYEARAKDCTTIIEGIDAYIESLPEVERQTVLDVLERMADLRRRATAPRSIDLRDLLFRETQGEFEAE